MVVSDWVTLVLVLVGVITVTVTVIVAGFIIPHHYLHRREAEERHAQLRAFQLENARSILEDRRAARRSHEELKTFLKSIGIRLEQVFERIDER